jgi:hypothetical protein
MLTDYPTITWRVCYRFQIKSFEVKKYDGQNWESFYSKADISKFSKAK